MTEAYNLLKMVNNIGSKIWKHYVSHNAAAPATAEAFGSEVLQKLGLTWVPLHAPAFYLNSRQVKILHEPKEFYNSLLQQIQTANHRIVLSSLYLGNGVLEKNIVVAIKRRLEEKPNLRVKIILDCTRGSRGQNNSRKMLMPLLEFHDKSCQVSLYKSPSLQNLFLPLIPSKYKEIAGLQHIKVYLFDDNSILTGANLSNDYFTLRQDRYMLISECKKLSDFIEGLVDRISDFSFHLSKEDKLGLSKNWPHNPLKTDPKLFKFAASAHIRNYYESFLDETKAGEDDTVIFPLLEMGPFDIHADSSVTTKILEKCSRETDVFLTTGYFNLTDSYVTTIIENSKAEYRILMAHPTANGFYQAKGPAGGIPYAYTSIALEFLEKVHSHGQSPRIQMLEYRRPGWTYHAKGLWLSSPRSRPPFLTMIGSPNFGERSLKRDLECQFLLATTDEELRGHLLEERKSLYESCLPFTEAARDDPRRKTPVWVKVVVSLFRSYL